MVEYSTALKKERDFIMRNYDFCLDHLRKELNKCIREMSRSLDNFRELSKNSQIKNIDKAKSSVDKYIKNKDTKKHIKFDYIYKIDTDFSLKTASLDKIITLMIQRIYIELELKYMTKKYEEFTDRLKIVSEKTYNDFLQLLNKSYAKNKIVIDKANDFENEYTAQRCSYLLLAHHNSFLKNLKNIGKAAKIPSCTTLYPNFRKTHKAMISESKNLQPIEIMTNYEAFTLNRLKVLSSHSCPNRDLHKYEELYHSENQNFSNLLQLKAELFETCNSECNWRLNNENENFIHMKTLVNNNLTFDSPNFDQFREKADENKLSEERIQKLWDDNEKDLLLHGVNSRTNFDQILELVKASLHFKPAW